MKYKVMTLTDGTFAVAAGKGRYFTNTLTENRNEAERTALQWSAQWYYTQAEKAFDEAEKNGYLNEYDGSLGDWLC